MILQRAGHDLGRARAVAIDEHDHRQVRVLAVFVRAVVLVRLRDAAARVDDHVAARKEPIGDLDSLVQRSTGIVAQVEHQALHPAVGQLLERGADFVVRRLGKISELDVARVLVDHEHAADRHDIDFVAFDIEIDQAVVAAPAEGDVDGRALRTFQLGDRLLARPALGVGAGDPRDDVAAAEALLVGGRAFEDGHHGDVAVDDLNLDPEAVVLAFLALAHLGVALGIEEAGMRIQGFQHPVDGAVDQAVRRHFVDVLAIDRGKRRRKDAILLRDLVLPAPRRCCRTGRPRAPRPGRPEPHGNEAGIAHDGS